MAISQNCLFASIGRAPASDEPGGRDLVETVGRSLAAGWEVSEPDLWRGCGWMLTVRRQNACLEVVVSEVEPEMWLLQVAPQYSPSFIGRLMGRRPSALPRECFLGAVDVANALDGIGVERQLWCWDGLPNEETGVARPTPPSAAA